MHRANVSSELLPIAGGISQSYEQPCFGAAVRMFDIKQIVLDFRLFDNGQLRVGELHWVAPIAAMSGRCVS
jgi:hypothetical protein